VTTELRDQTGRFGAAWSAGLAAAPEADLDAWLALAQAACDEADAIARSVFRRDLEISTKPDRTFVTQADTAIERTVRSRILAAYPDHGLVGEEYGVEAGEARTRWYIDPIDGTHNFIRGVPLFGTLLAVERDGELQAAVLSAPALRERWWARRGGGAWAHGADESRPRRIRVSGVRELGDAQILYGSGHDVETSGLAPGFHALLAEGAAEAMLEVGLNSWDAAAPTVLIEEAGGRVTDFAGRRAIDAGSFLATNGLLHDVVLERLVGPA
jgi:histidinol-phosphatase